MCISADGWDGCDLTASPGVCGCEHFRAVFSNAKLILGAVGLPLRNVENTKRYMYSGFQDTLDGSYQQ